MGVRPVNSASCGGKEALTWTEAERRARGLRRKTGKHVTPYHCRQCGFRHIGNSIGGDVGRRIRRDLLTKIERREMRTR
jgi:hypothetical protein